MGGNVLINDTAYTIKAGKTMVGGTEYKIARSKTRVDGTAYTIEFPADVEDIFRSMRVISKSGADGTTSGASTVRATPAVGFWLMDSASATIVASQDFGIVYFDDVSVGATGVSLIEPYSEEYGIEESKGSPILYIGTSSRMTYRAAVLANVAFDGYSTDAVQTALSSLQSSLHAQNSGSSRTSVSIKVSEMTAGDILVVCPGLDFAIVKVVSVGSNPVFDVLFTTASASDSLPSMLEAKDPGMKDPSYVVHSKSGDLLYASCIYVLRKKEG